MPTEPLQADQRYIYELHSYPAKISLACHMQHLFYSIKEPLVCSRCGDEFAAGNTNSASLRDYTTLDVGFTDKGVQVWCRRHGTNVVHIDFDGHRPAADFRCLERKTNIRVVDD